MIKLSSDLKQFCCDIGYEFQDPGLLVTAMTHSSVSSSTRSANERLEFLGDRVLGLVMAQALLDADEIATEGQLAPRLNALVRKETCADVGRSIGIGEMLKLGRSEMISGGRRKEALLGDAMEALIAAVYSDGGFIKAQELVLKLWGSRIFSVEFDARDAKTALQELTQVGKGSPPRYVEISRFGPDHAPTFIIEVQLHSGESARAEGASKRQAEQAAAKKMLTKFQK